MPSYLPTQPNLILAYICLELPDLTCVLRYSYTLRAYVHMCRTVHIHPHMRTPVHTCLHACVRMHARACAPTCRQPHSPVYALVLYTCVRACLLVYVHARIPSRLMDHSLQAQDLQAVSFARRRPQSGGVLHGHRGHPGFGDSEAHSRRWKRVVQTSGGRPSQ